MIKLPNGCPAFLTGAGKKGLVVIQEWWGLNEQIKAIGGRLAAAGGFKALAPDLYHGKVTAKEDEAHHLMDNLNWPGAVADIQQAVDYLKKEVTFRMGKGNCLSIVRGAKRLP